MTKLSLDDWKQEEFERKDFKDSRIIYSNTVQRCQNIKKKLINYYGNSVKNVGLVRVDEQDILYAKKFRRELPFKYALLLKGQRTDGSGCRDLKDNKYKYKDGQRLQGLVREDKTTENTIYNTNQTEPLILKHVVKLKVLRHFYRILTIVEIS